MKHKSNHGRHAARKKRLPLWLWLVPSLMLFIGLGAIGVILQDRYSTRADYQQMSAQVQELREGAVSATGAPETAVTPKPAAAVDATEPAEIPASPDATAGPVREIGDVLPQYQQLVETNPDMVGWLQIEGTVIDYPVMYNEEEPEEYLHRDFYGDYSFAGVPFLDSRCAEDSDNLLIYGHNMDDGTMFHVLPEYQYKKYWQEHPVIRFDSLTEEREYEVMAVFYDRVYYTHETDFRFYNFIDAADKAEFDRVVRIFKDKSILDTGVTAEYGQQLITLITCTYLEDNGRFVVVACEKEP